MMMKKLIALLTLLGMALGATSALAAEAADGSQGFWDKLRRKIELMAPQKGVSATTAVGGVRGAQVTASDTYWKGEKTAPKIDADELEEFQKAMALAESGKSQEAQAAFAEFVKKNPDSPLRKDAEQALAQLQPK
jgi:TolA-binding protein